jgi:hypothetical protein
VFHRGVTATPQPHTLDESRLVEPDSRRSSGREFLTATPGRLSVLAVVLIAAPLAAGVATAAAVADRQQRLYDHWYSAVMGPVASPPPPTYRD